MSRTQPVTLGLAPSFGFGDRLGFATPGHLASLRQAGGPIKGIFAQQSIREMQRTDRTATEVMTAATDALTAAGFDDAWGADADHLKTPEDVEVTAAAGFTFYTIDPSDHVDQQADSYGADELAMAYKQVCDAVDWVDRYLNETVKVDGGPTITFDEPTVMRAAVKYGRAINHARSLARSIEQITAKHGADHEIELSVDETDQPTTLAEHYIIAEQVLEAGVKLVSLAPRYIGEFEKGVDYIGDVAALEASIADHAAIARQLGPYKLSLHSGSDKLSMYAAFARATGGLLHVKTAGTSYLEALRVVLMHDEDLFRQVVAFSRDRYDADRATYHVHAANATVPSADDLADAESLEKVYLERWEDVAAGEGFTEAGRQILHCAFGSVMTDPRLGSSIKQLLSEQADDYAAVLEAHFVKHLEPMARYC